MHALPTHAAADPLFVCLAPCVRLRPARGDRARAPTGRADGRHSGTHAGAPSAAAHAAAARRAAPPQAGLGGRARADAEAPWPAALVAALPRRGAGLGRVQARFRSLGRDRSRPRQRLLPARRKGGLRCDESGGGHGTGACRGRRRRRHGAQGVCTCVGEGSTRCVHAACARQRLQFLHFAWSGTTPPPASTVHRAWQWLTLLCSTSLSPAAAHSHTHRTSRKPVPLATAAAATAQAAPRATTPTPPSPASGVPAPRATVRRASSDRRLTRTTRGSRRPALRPERPARGPLRHRMSSWPTWPRGCGRARAIRGQRQRLGLLAPTQTPMPGRTPGAMRRRNLEARCK